MQPPEDSTNFLVAWASCPFPWTTDAAQISGIKEMSARGRDHLTAALLSNI